jgi:hypothetical protein
MDEIRGLGDFKAVPVEAFSPAETAKVLDAVDSLSALDRMNLLAPALTLCNWAEANPGKPVTLLVEFRAKMFQFIVMESKKLR